MVQFFETAVEQAGFKDEKLSRHNSAMSTKHELGRPLWAPP